MKNKHEGKKLWSASDLIQFLGIGRTTYHALLKKGELPAGVKLACSWRWDPDTVRKWVLENECEPTINILLSEKTSKSNSSTLASSSTTNRKKGRPTKEEQINNRMKAKNA